ncbi:MBL fold metallo-hydrolase [Mesonia aquimarina]|uniref:MBL fold metallo-hydrolase n=1 Tax=Mesonia aquimarina TaxID=1504967 RepID=UPI000EF56C8B|nr:MBL fold metallo-hydrolase [Mesonia aquimarina]
MDSLKKQLKANTYLNEIEVKDDILYYINNIVNAVMIGTSQTENWVLIDTGLPNSADKIMSVAHRRFGKNNPPAAIILTHGHFDHVGGVVDLINAWNIPVYAHPKEFDYLTGKTAYQSVFKEHKNMIFNQEPINIKCVLKELPENGVVPFLKGWKWIHVPGHSPGHIALYREKDKILIAGDAFVSMSLDAFYNTQKKTNSSVYMPPAYFSSDRENLKASLEKLMQVNPEKAIMGHGEHLSGKKLRVGLQTLLKSLDE